MSWPCKRISLLSENVNPAILRNNVVLPQPEGPSSVRNSFSRIFTETLSSARASPWLLATPKTSIASAGATIRLLFPVAAHRVCAARLIHLG